MSKLIKSQTQSDGKAGWSATETRANGESERSERQRYSGMATGYPVTVPGKEAALLRQGTANAPGDEQEPSPRKRDLRHAGLVGRACNTR